MTFEDLNLPRGKVYSFELEGVSYQVTVNANYEFSEEKAIAYAEHYKKFFPENIPKKEGAVKPIVKLELSLESGKKSDFSKENIETILNSEELKNL